MAFSESESNFYEAEVLASSYQVEMKNWTKIKMRHLRLGHWTNKTGGDNTKRLEPFVSLVGAGRLSPWKETRSCTQGQPGGVVHSEINSKRRKPTHSWKKWNKGEEAGVLQARLGFPTGLLSSLVSLVLRAQSGGHQKEASNRITTTQTQTDAVICCVCTTHMCDISNSLTDLKLGELRLRRAATA